MHFFDYHVKCLLSTVLLFFSLCQEPHQPQILTFVAWIRKLAVLQDMIRSTYFVTKCRKVIKCLFRCFDTVFRRPYRYFSIALKLILSLFDRYKIFTSDWLWIEICQIAGFSKIEITVTTINKNFEVDKNPIFARSRPTTEKPIKAIEKYRYGLRKTVLKHLKFRVHSEFLYLSL